MRKMIGSYEVQRELGQGGMGVVCLARQSALDREVVIKALRRSLAGDASIEERFRREAQAAAGIHHQNVVAVYDCFALRGEWFIVQEYVAGDDLANVLKVVRRLDPRIAGLVALELARGLEEVHARDVVHRDLKPGNVLLGRGGEAKIADFGIALEPRNTALTEIGCAVGTPVYMSPEQHRGDRADQRSDLFAFGVLLYEMLTGELPFPASDGEEEPTLARKMEAGRYTHPRKLAPETPHSLARLIRSCLRARPKRRMRSATALRSALERLCGHPSPAQCRAEISDWLWERKVFQVEANATERAQPAPQAERRTSRRLGWAAAIAGCAVVLAGLGAVGFEAVPSVLALPTALRELAHGSPEAPARVSFEAPAQTAIRIDGGPPFRTPRPEPVELTPGIHHVTFQHPVFGTSERRIEVVSGREQRVAHVFETPAEGH
jgi:serine/threonine-protein kinase